MTDAEQLNPVALSGDGTGLVILDQTLLPNETRYLTLRSAEEIVEAIRSLRVRGAPALGVTGALAYAVLAGQIETDDMDAFASRCAEIPAYLGSARPTAVNLSWALDRMHALLLREREGRTVKEMKARLMEEAAAVRAEDIEVSRSIGALGLGLLRDIGRGAGILTHCNAGTLAAVRYGTALAPIYAALEDGWDPKRDLHVYCDETRPLLQGARLTAYELTAAGVDTHLQCDSMAACTMQSGKIDAVFVGCDRVAANGDFANKIGTCGLAVLAGYYGIPFYVCAPTSTIDMTLETGAGIPIEERSPEEVTEMWYRQRMAPEGVGVVNPAFDVTDHTLVTAFLTEKGLARAPFPQSFETLGIRPGEPAAGPCGRAGEGAPG